MVPGFTSVTETELQVPCTYDLEVASARYLQGLDDGTIPLLLLFSGTVFVATGRATAVELIPWSSEASYRMPVSVWQDVVNEHFPGSAWLRCSQRDAGRAVRVQGGARAADLGRHAGGAARQAAGRRRRRRLERRGAAADPPARTTGGGGAAVTHWSLDAVRRIADAVLYEGYILYPYRASAAEEPQPLAVRRAHAARLRRGRPVGDRDAARRSACSSTTGAARG